MSRFTDAITDETGRVICGRREIVLLSPLVYEIGYLGSGLKVEAPTAFLSDGVSVGHWIGRWMPLKLMLRSAVVHDLMRKDLRFDKFFADYVFYEAMGVEKVPTFWRIAATLAVLGNFSRF